MWEENVLKLCNTPRVKGSLPPLRPGKQRTGGIIALIPPSMAGARKVQTRASPQRVIKSITPPNTLLRVLYTFSCIVHAIRFFLNVVGFVTANIAVVVEKDQQTFLEHVSTALALLLLRMRNASSGMSIEELSPGLSV